VGPLGAEGLAPAAVAAVRAAAAVFVDDYTAAVPAATLAFLESARGGPLERLGRARLEEGGEVLRAAKEPGGAALVVAGDPMAATTHVSLRIAAVRAGIPVRILFAPSITHTAFSEAGLQHYKAGRTVSIPYPQKGFAPTSPLERIGENRAAGLHTLVLLDLKVEEGRYMTAPEGLEALLEMASRAPHAKLGPGTLAVAVERAGESDARARAGSIERLLTMRYGPPMHCLILPGALHFEEREALVALCGAREDELGA
jgi:diphthine synthase